MVASKQSLNYIRDGQSKVRTRDGCHWHRHCSTHVRVLHQHDPLLFERRSRNGEGLVATACVNCCIWVAYGLFKERRDWPVAIANAPGIIFGGVTAIIALM